MRAGRLRIAVIACGLASAWYGSRDLHFAARAQEAAATFRATTNSVSVDVSVRRQNRPVSGLLSGDFEVFDNGVPQDVVDVSYERLPIDVTVVLDVSASVTGPVLAQLQRSVEQLQADLGPQDRLKVLTFNMRIQQLSDFVEPSRMAALGPMTAAGSTALFDAIAVALTTSGPPDRRQLVVVFSDGDDSVSVIDAETLLDVARRNSPTVAVVIASPVERATAALFANLTVPTVIYDRLASETGGLVLPVHPGENLSTMFRRVLAEFRSSYVLHYIPKGVEPRGTHTLDVRVKYLGVDVRARRSYVWK